MEHGKYISQLFKQFTDVRSVIQYHLLWLYRPMVLCFSHLNNSCKKHPSKVIEKRFRVI